jgi:hypothetical protein
VRNRIRSAMTQDQDKRILELYLGSEGKRPVSAKQIVIRLNLSSVWVVYGAIRRYKYAPTGFHMEPKTNQKKQTSF